MTLNNLISRQELLDNRNDLRSIASKVIRNEINSKEQLTEYAIQDTIKMLYSNAPKLYDKNDNLIIDFFDSHKLQALQKLEELCYRYGASALSENFEPAIIEIPEQDVFVYDEEVKYLRVKKVFEANTITVIETYTKIDGMVEFNYDIEHNAAFSNEQVSKVVKDMYEYKKTHRYLEYIPYQIFFNDHRAKPEIDLVQQGFFNALDIVWSLITQDGYWAAPWLFVVENRDYAKQVKAGLLDLKQRIININEYAAEMTSTPIHLVQGNSQAISLIQTADFVNKWITKLGFLKPDTSDFGTKNIHNAEAQGISSQYQKHINSKANLREIQLKEFLDKFYDGYEIAKVVVNSSTEWLKTEAKELNVDLNGTAINPTAIQNEQYIVDKENDEKVENGNSED